MHHCRHWILSLESLGSVSNLSHRDIFSSSALALLLFPLPLLVEPLKDPLGLALWKVYQIVVMGCYIDQPAAKEKKGITFTYNILTLTSKILSEHERENTIRRELQWLYEWSSCWLRHTHYRWPTQACDQDMLKGASGQPVRKDKISADNFLPETMHLLNYNWRFLAQKMKIPPNQGEHIYTWLSLTVR